MIQQFVSHGKACRLTVECEPGGEKAALSAALLPEAPRYTPKPLRPAVLDGHVATPLPGTVIAVCAQQGQHVQAGAVLCVVEAMKMENELHAPFAGVVEAAHTHVGDTVKAGMVLFEIKQEGNV